MGAKVRKERDRQLDIEVSKGKLEKIAEIFRAFAEPTRLTLLQGLRGHDELSVGELVELSGTTQANVSKHLKVLHGVGLLNRQRRGNQTFYGISDPIVVELLQAVCGKLNREALESAQVDYSL